MLGQYQYHDRYNGRNAYKIVVSRGAVSRELYLRWMPIGSWGVCVIVRFKPVSICGYYMLSTLENLQFVIVVFIIGF